MNETYQDLIKSIKVTIADTENNLQSAKRIMASVEAQLHFGGESDWSVDDLTSLYNWLASLSYPVPEDVCTMLCEAPIC